MVYKMDNEKILYDLFEIKENAILNNHNNCEFINGLVHGIEVAMDKLMPKETMYMVEIKTNDDYHKAKLEFEYIVPFIENYLDDYENTQITITVVDGDKIGENEQ